METEFEATFLDIDKDEVRKKLKEAGEKQGSSTFFEFIKKGQL